jgi:hypothetical protein
MIFENTTFVDNATDTPGRRSVLSIYVYGTFLTVILLLSLVGNILVATGIITIRQLQKDKSNIFLVNLSITDMSNAILVMSSSLIALFTDEWRMPAFWCKLQCAFNYCFIIVSMLTLALISIDRYHAVKNALEYPSIITKKRIYFMILYTWVQGFAFAVTPMILGWIKYDYEEVVCAIDWYQGTSTIYYVVVANILCFIIPGVILVYCYVVVAKIAKRLAQGTAIPSGTSIRSRCQNDSNMNRIFKCFIVVVAIFFFCMTPFCITKLVKVVTGNPKLVPGYIITISTLLQYSASATNPFIYGIFRRDFRLGFKRQLQKLFCSAPCDAEMISSASNTSNRQQSSDALQVM